MEDKDAVLTNGRGPYSRYGGSAKYSGLIATLAPEHTKYVEPFAGAASVFFTKDKASKSVLADLDDELVNALRQLKAGDKNLISQLMRRERMVTTERFKKLVRSKPKSAIDRLHRFLFIQGAGYSGKRCGPPPEAKKGKPAYNPERLLPFMEKLKGVSIEKSPFEQTLARHDGKDTFFFIDPPYPKEWKHTADDIDRERGEAFLDVPKFVKAVRALKGHWIVALGDNKENIDALKALGGTIFYKRGTETTNTGGTKEAKRYFAANFDVKTAARQKAIMSSGGFSKLVVAKVLLHPNEGESKKGFVTRFMDDSKAVEEFPKSKQRYAVGMQIWERSNRALEKRLALWGSTAGKSRVAKRVIPMIPEHKTYVEPFAGGAAVFYAKPKEASTLEVLSDTNKNVAFSFKYVRDGSEKDFANVRSKNWVVSKDQARRVHDLKPSNGADRFYRFAYKRYAMFFRNENRITAIDPAKAGKKPTLVDNLEKTKERLKGVKVHNDSYQKVVKAYDGKDTFFYLDPPYPRIAQEVGEEAFDEPAFIKVLQKMKGKFLLHYDYRDKSKFLNKGWNVKVISVNKTGGGTTATTKGKLLEVTNYTPTRKAVPGSESDDTDQGTPALSGERRAGSSKNPKGSASTEGGKIELSAATNKTLQTKLDNHNEKVGKDKSKRTDLRSLQSVYRRGAGAFSTSHRPGMTRAQWAVARVNHFLHLLETGKPKDSKYITDNDLLPSNHPALEKAEGFVPPKSVRDAAAKGLELRREWDRGGLSVQQASDEGVGSGVQRAVNLKNGDSISKETLKMMRGFFARHEKNNQPSKKMSDGGPTAGTIAWLLWGGDPGRAWANKLLEEIEMEKADPKHFGGGENIDVFGYKTENFDICRSAVMLFKKLGKTKEEETQKHVVKAAKYLDAFFGIEKKVVEANASSAEDGEVALDLAILFAYEVGIVAERMSRSYDRDIAFVKMHFNEIGSRMVSDKVAVEYGFKEGTDNADVNWTMPIIKKDDDERIVTGIVLEPDEVDAQGDTVSKEAIKEAAYRFLAKFNKDTELGFMHKAFGNLGISLVESWVAREDCKYGGSPVKSGSWLMSVKVDKNDTLWKKIKAGEISGFSIGGVARVS